MRSLTKQSFYKLILKGLIANGLETAELRLKWCRYQSLKPAEVEVVLEIHFTLSNVVPKNNTFFSAVKVTPERLTGFMVFYLTKLWLVS